MTHAALAPLIGPEFDGFLYAMISEEKNGKGLSVISMLARSNVDPWQEAASLARMPREAARTRLAALIAALPSEPGVEFSAKAPIPELVALLPSPNSFDVLGLNDGVETISRQRPNVSLALSILTLAVFVVFVVTFNLLPRPASGAKPSAVPVAGATTVAPPKLDP
jgi:hypothetical protein